MELTILRYIVLLLYIVAPTLALDILNLETKYYYMIGAGGGAILIVLICICWCCCCRKKKTVPQKSSRKHVSEIRVPEVRPSQGQEPLQRTDSQQMALPLVRTESERRLAANAEHRRRLDAILTTQAAAGRDFNRSSTRDERLRPDKPNPGHVGQESGTTRQHLPITPASTRTDSNDRDIRTIHSPSDQYGHSPNSYNTDNVVGSFVRIPPYTATSPGQRSTTTREESPAWHEEKPEFVGFKLKPVVLNRAGGTYIPPDDF